MSVVEDVTLEGPMSEITITTVAERVSALIQHLELIDKKHDDGHKRLRGDLEETKKTVESNWQHFTDQFSLVRAELGEIKTLVSTPIDATKLVLQTKAIIAVVVAALTIAAMLWALRSDVQSVSAQVSAQKEAAVAAAKLEEEQMGRLRDAVAASQRQSEETKRNYELLRFEFQGLKETVLKGRPQ